MAVLIGAGFAFSYALDGQGVKPGTTAEDGSLDLIRNVLIIGIITLIATRLYGNLGLIVVGATASVSFFRQAPAVAALFIAARSLEQAFDVNYVANVTGINLMHPYVTAAQYFGFFTILALVLLLKEGRGRNFETVAVTSVAVIGPALINYFLHAEASASYMVALTVAGVLVAILGQKFFYEQENLCASLMLIATQSSAIGLLTAEVIEIGNSTSNPERLKIVYCLAGVMAILMIVSILRSKKAGADNPPSSPPVEAAAVPGE
jgi:peptidoglycan/LPS O-acetylase OafA/YrhL